MRQNLLKTLLLAVAVLLATIPLQAQSFSGSGSGTESDPYLIYNPIHLNDVHNFIGQEGVVFKMMQDVDLTSWLADNNPTNGWLPIGTQAQPFKGKFLGNGKKITGVFINRASMDYVGFFGYSQNATIGNLSIEGSSVNGKSVTGSLVGYMNDGTITNVSATMNVIGAGMYTGGFVGYAYANSSISNSQYRGTVNGTSSVGGFCGYTYHATFTNDAANVIVTATGDDSGTFIGRSSSVTISGATVSGDVNGINNVGGLIGIVPAFSNYENPSRVVISDSKVNGNQIGTDNVGGLIGMTGKSCCSEISNSFAVGDITGTSSLGGIIGSSGYQFAINGCAHIGDITSTAMSTADCYVGGIIGNAKENYTIVTTDPLATLSTDSRSIVNCYSVGDIYGQGNFVGGLIGNRYMTDCKFQLSDVFPIDVYSNYLTYSSYAAGRYKLLYRTTQKYNGEYLYYFTNKITAYVNKLESLGILVLYDNSLYSTGYYTPNGTHYDSINLTQYTFNTNTPQTIVSNSYHSGDIYGKNNVGGLIGYGNSVNLNSNYASGKIYANQYVGGVAGKIERAADAIENSIITSCVSANEVIVGVSGNTGRIYGSAGSGVTIGATGTTSANKGLATAKVTSAGSTVLLEDNPQHGINVGAATLRIKSNYVGMGWDFDNYWKIQETECYPYKATQCAPPKITSSLSSGATSVSGQSIDGGTVNLLMGNYSYSGAVSNNQWTVSVPDGLQSGAIIKACAVKEGLMQSYFTTGTVGFAGSGTEDDPYLIYTASDLANINSYSYYKVMNDIDVSGWITTYSPTTGWIPVGMNSGVSMKQLDGNGKTITGLWMNSDINYYGLISTTENATIKDLTIKLAKNTILGGNSAILVGKSVNTTFSNISIVGNISGKGNIGAVTGLGTGNTFENCTVTSNITGNGIAGGISGNSASSTFNNCHYKGTLRGSDYLGGIAGGEAGSNSYNLCAVEGTINGADYLGGIAAVCTGSVTKSKATVVINGTNFVGGLVGNSSASISECSTTGAVTGTATTCYAGGMTGTNNGSITNCYSTATVTSGEYAAGIAGLNYGTINKCYASGNITAEKWGAGIVGYNDGSNAWVTNCFAANNKIVVSEAGGIGMRMIGGFRNGASEPDRSNYAINSMVVSVNNVTKIIYDDPLEGNAIENAALMQQSTYAAQGWDFGETWGIDEGEGYPFLQALVEAETPDVLPGDVNGDGTVNVTDYVAVARYILEQNPQPFILAAADLDGNETVNVTDLVRVAILALNFEGNAPRRAPAAVVGDIAMDAALCENELTIDLNSDIDITALQMDIALPAGVSVTEAVLTDRASASHTVDVAQLTTGDYRLLAASSLCKAFKGHEGAVLRIKLSGEPQASVTLHSIQLASTAADGFEHDDIVLAPVVTALNDLSGQTRVYGENGQVIVEAPVAGNVVIALPNGMNITRAVKAGRNVISVPARGIVIVKAGDKATKLIL